MKEYNISREYQKELLRKYGKDLLPEQKGHASFSEKDVKEIGVKKFKIYNREVKVLRWGNKNKTIVEVEVTQVNPVTKQKEKTIGFYEYPFHKSCYRPAENFRVIDGLFYLEKYANGELYNERYGVINDRVVYDNGYLGDDRHHLPNWSQMGIKVSETKKIIL